MRLWPALRPTCEGVSEAVARDVQKLQTAARDARQVAAEKLDRPDRNLVLIEAARRRRRKARYQRWQEVVELFNLDSEVRHALV
jgi:hypothetical protein